MNIISYEHANLAKTAVALGKFQGLHKGHMLLIDEIIRISHEKKVSSAVFTINMPSEKILHLPEERYNILERKGIEFAVECQFSKEFAAMTPEQFVREVLVERLNVAFVCVGTDFRFGCNREGNVDTLYRFGEIYNFEVIAFDKLKISDTVVSSSLLREKVLSGNMDEFCEYAGRYYCISGDVLFGKQIGRTIGFPTANILPDDRKLLPPFGVYETYVIIDGVQYKGVTNVGDNPTISGDNPVSIETNIIDFDGNLYGRHVEVYFKRFLRPQVQFNNLEELKKQINSDRNRVIMHQ